jgi:hypothetical protein
MQVHGQNVFPLKKINARYDGYYVNRDGKILSTRKTKGQLVELKGSQAHSWSPRYVTLAGATFGYNQMVGWARAHADWNKEMAEVSLTSKEYKDTGAMGFGRTKSAAEVVKAKGIMLATIGEHDQLVFGSKPVFHKEAKTARAEAERIAKESGLKVVMLQVVGAVSVGKTVWE